MLILVEQATGNGDGRKVAGHYAEHNDHFMYFRTGQDGIGQDGIGQDGIGQDGIVALNSVSRIATLGEKDEIYKTS